MDLNEHALSEAQRTLKRLGIAHVFRTGRANQASAASEPSPVQVRPKVQSPAPADVAPPAQAPPDSALPLLLRSLFHGKHTPASTLWTYAGLYRDLQETDNPPRLTVFKKIQESVCLHLKWEGSRLCAWPLDIEPGIFKQGMDRFMPRTVILFSTQENAQDNRFKENLAILGQANRPVVTLPSLEDMALGNQQLKNEAWKILQTIKG